MDVPSALKHQYHAALQTLRDAILKTPDSLWASPAHGQATISCVAYHTLFFTHFYLQQSPAHFTPWPHHQPGAERLSDPPIPPRPNSPQLPLPKQTLLDFWTFVDAQVDPSIDRLDLSADPCGFPWYPMPTLEHQLVNIRHIQNHAAALASRLRHQAQIEVDWFGRA